MAALSFGREFVPFSFNFERIFLKDNKFSTGFRMAVAWPVKNVVYPLQQNHSSTASFLLCHDMLAYPILHKNLHFTAFRTF